MATASSFSYAQAAKGQAASLPTTPANAVSPDASSQPGPSVTQDLQSDDTKSTPPLNTTQPTGTIENRPLNGEKHELESNLGSEADSVQARRADSRREDEPSRLDRPWRRTERGTRSSSIATRSVDEQESRKSRKGKKARGSDKQSTDPSDKAQDLEDEQPKIELSEAPIPSVNIWLQRKEAQEAKKPSSAGGSENNEPVAVVTTDEGMQSGRVTSDLPVQAANVAKSSRKAGDNIQRTGSRGSRGAEALDSKSVIPPSVEDAILWPTPETAVQEDKKKTSDKVERTEKESQDENAPSKPRSKEKWVTYDYVPTVNFETQLPQMRNSKPRGGSRNANSARNNGSNQTGDKSAGIAPSNKTNDTRNRRESANDTTRTASLPPTTKQTSIDVAQSREPRKVSGNTPSEKAKDVATRSSNEQSPAPRERPEGRADRGRGGYRLRGGHHAINTQIQTQHVTSGFSTAVVGRGQGPYSPPPRQGQHGQGFMPPPQRGGRGGRNGAGNNFHRMSLPNSATRLPPLQAQFGSYDYPSPMSAMSALPFQPQPSYLGDVPAMLQKQIEYYFSIENLCKDMYLRARMDSQGFVPLHFIAAFKRVRILSSDMSLVRAVCEGSTEIDFVVGEDDLERIRRRDGWENFVLPLEERDDFARNNGPAHLTFKNRPFSIGHQFNGLQGSMYNIAALPAFVPQNEIVMQQYAETQMPTPPSNGMVNGNGHKASTQLSADVPDFSPSGFVPHGTLSASPILNGQNENVTERFNGVTADSLSQS